MAEERNTDFPDVFPAAVGWGRRLWRLGIALLLVGLLVWVVKSDLIDRSISGDTLKSAVEIFNIDSHWVVKQRVDEPDFKGVILVPQFSFQVRNTGTETLEYVFFLGVFRFLDNGKTMGEGYQMALEEPLEPGAESGRIVLKSGFGYRATSEQAFDRNPRDWRSAFVEVFLRSKTSRLVFFKSYYISRRVAGTDVDVTI